MANDAIMRKAELIAEAFRLKSMQNNTMDPRRLRKFEETHKTQGDRAR